MRPTCQDRIEIVIAYVIVVLAILNGCTLITGTYISFVVQLNFWAWDTFCMMLKYKLIMIATCDIFQKFTVMSKIDGENKKTNSKFILKTRMFRPRCDKINYFFVLIQTFEQKAFIPPRIEVFLFHFSHKFVSLIRQK